MRHVACRSLGATHSSPSYNNTIVHRFLEHFIFVKWFNTSQLEASDRKHSIRIFSTGNPCASCWFPDNDKVLFVFLNSEANCEQHLTLFCYFAQHKTTYCARYTRTVIWQNDNKVKKPLLRRLPMLCTPLSVTIKQLTKQSVCFSVGRQ